MCRRRGASAAAAGGVGGVGGGPQLRELLSQRRILLLQPGERRAVRGELLAKRRVCASLLLD